MGICKQCGESDYEQYACRSAVFKAQPQRNTRSIFWMVCYLCIHATEDKMLHNAKRRDVLSLLPARGLQPESGWP
jgi:hypothetical protein